MIKAHSVLSKITNFCVKYNYTEKKKKKVECASVTKNDITIMTIIN